MRQYIIKRSLLLIITLWGITLVSFCMLQLAPGSPLEMRLQMDPAGGLGQRSTLSEEHIQNLREQFHLDRPILMRYWLWLKDIVSLDFGNSFIDHRPVIDKISERLPVSLILGFSGILLAVLVGIPLGLTSGIFQNRFVDRAIAFLSIGLFALPAYVMGIVLILLLGGVGFLDVFPIYGMQSDHYHELSLFGRILDRLYHFVLPCSVYATAGLAFIIQQQRNAMLDALHQDYVRTARAKGLSESVVFLKHAFRNSLIPIVTILGALIPTLLGASIIIEKIFSIPGLGLLAYESLLQRDYPTIMANFTIGALLSLLGIFLSDILYVVVDPRISFEGQ